MDTRARERCYLPGDISAAQEACDVDAMVLELVHWPIPLSPPLCGRALILTPTYAQCLTSRKRDVIAPEADPKDIHPDYGLRFALHGALTLTLHLKFLGDHVSRFAQPEPQPDNEEHDQKVAAINEDIKKIKDQIEALRAKIDEANEARRGQGVSKTQISWW